MTDVIPEWKKFLVRQLTRNQVSTLLCQAILDRGISIPELAAKMEMKEAQVVHSLRPENVGLDEIADVCCAMDAMPVFELHDVGGAPAVQITGGMPLSVRLSSPDSSTDS